MVRALLARRKRQTRRVMKPQPITPAVVFGSTPYGMPGDRLWVREAHKLQDLSPRGFPQCLIGYRADGEVRICDPGENDMARPLEPREAGCAIGHDRWRPSIHMPRWASRLTLPIAAVRVERLQDISDEDAIAEGIDYYQRPGEPRVYRDYSQPDVHYGLSPIGSYRTLWESINGPGSWDANPFVWVIEFETEGARA